MKMITIYMPSNSNHTANANRFISDMCIHFGGCTYFEAKGAWKNNTAIDTTVVQVCVDIETEAVVNTMKRCITNALVVGKQQSALVKWTDGYCQYITEDDRPC
tara:strand:+ start:443 stop:751 length:309 start_codon:yes stop_codon:yes gene_type:complete